MVVGVYSAVEVWWGACGEGVRGLPLREGFGGEGARVGGMG
jgi:hypothetical protein